MPNPLEAAAANVPGPWYVDTSCISCGLCENYVPDVFEMSPDGATFLVFRQPTTPQELAEAEDARERCPAEAIGNDRR